jgi:hypothetical protein
VDGLAENQLLPESREFLAQLALRVLPFRANSGAPRVLLLSGSVPGSLTSLVPSFPG